MSSPSPKPQTVTQTTSSEPWSGQRPHLLDIFSRAQGLSNQPRAFFPGRTFADFAPETESALGMQTSRALAGSPFMRAAGRNLFETARGDFLGAENPYFSAMADRIKGSIMPGIAAKWLGSGGAGAGMGRALGLGLGDAIGTLAFQNYGAERDRQMQAAGMAPQFANQDYFDIAQLGQVGAAREAQGQRGIDEALARHEFAQNEPYDRLAAYKALVDGNYGGSSTTTGQQFIPQTNPWAQGLGLGLGALGMLGKLGVFSDARLKTDVKPVGETFGGLPIYTYRMKSGGAPLMGVMAQDVARVKPEALGAPRGGFLTVDYGRL